MSSVFFKNDTLHATVREMDDYVIYNIKNDGLTIHMYSFVFFIWMTCEYFVSSLYYCFKNLRSNVEQNFIVYFINLFKTLNRGSSLSTQVTRKFHRFRVGIKGICLWKFKTNLQTIFLNIFFCNLS